MISFRLLLLLLLCVRATTTTTTTTPAWATYELSATSATTGTSPASLPLQDQQFSPRILADSATASFTVNLEGDTDHEDEDDGHDDTATTMHDTASGSTEHEDIHPAHAVLFAPFSLTLGVVVFYLLTRYMQALPYTAVMFLLGTVMGIGVVVVGGKDHISESLHLWINIDSEVLLLVFLPGLIYKDAHGLNVHLFRIALPQCLLFAFPMVLAGTAITACIAYYIFPYDWSFDLAMCFGAM